jgi:hypothetical protein
MKSELKNNNVIENVYPYLGKFPKDSEKSVIVLFTRKSTGTVIFSSFNAFKNKVGEFSDTWVESDFENFNGEVILKN